jgi:hypothetical protein
MSGWVWLAFAYIRERCLEDIIEGKMRRHLTKRCTATSAAPSAYDHHFAFDSFWFCPLFTAFDAAVGELLTLGHIEHHANYST